MGENTRQHTCNAKTLTLGILSTRTHQHNGNGVCLLQLNVIIADQTHFNDRQHNTIAAATSSLSSSPYRLTALPPVGVVSVSSSSKRSECPSSMDVRQLQRCLRVQYATDGSSLSAQISLRLNLALMHWYVWDVCVCRSQNKNWTEKIYTHTKKTLVNSILP